MKNTKISSDMRRLEIAFADINTFQCRQGNTNKSPTLENTRIDPQLSSSSRVLQAKVKSILTLLGLCAIVSASPAAAPAPKGTAFTATVSSLCYPQKQLNTTSTLGSLTNNPLLPVRRRTRQRCIPRDFLRTDALPQSGLEGSRW